MHIISDYRAEVHARIVRVLPAAVLHTPYAEVERCTITGSHTIQMVSAPAPRLRRSIGVLFSISVFAGFAFAAMRTSSIDSLQFSDTSPALEASAELPRNIVESGVTSPQIATPKQMTLLERMQQRRQTRTESAAMREPVHAAAPTRLPPQILNQHGVYLTASSIARTTFFDDTIADLKNARGSAVVFDVKGGGVLYHSSAPDALEIGLVRSFYDLPAVIEKLHAQGIGVIGRFVAIKDEAYTKRKPETRMKDPVTGRVLSEWIDPANDEAIRYNMQVICELAAAGIDEINLDYIRNSGADGTLYGLSGEEKAVRLEKFIRSARETIDRCGPSTRLGLSTFAILGWSYDNNVETIGQDVRRFAPYVDVISPMAYPATFSVNAYYDPAKHPRSRMYYLVYRTLIGYRDLLGPEHAWKIRPWIQGYGVTTKNMQDQMDAVYDAGACGYQVWSASNTYAPTFAGMNTVSVPDRCVAAANLVKE